MSSPLQTQFVIADAGHARWVERSRVGEGFVTTMELTASHRGPARAERATFEGGPADVADKREGDFAKALADEINARAASNRCERLALVAPASFLSDLRPRLSTTAQAKLAHTLAKDLANTPDHELANWLQGLELDLD